MRRRRSDLSRAASPPVAGAGPRDLTFEVGSDAWGLNPWATRGASSHTMAIELLRADPCGYH
jgi:hypothetical protein